MLGVWCLRVLSETDIDASLVDSWRQWKDNRGCKALQWPSWIPTIPMIMRPSTISSRESNNSYGRLQFSLSLSLSAHRRQPRSLSMHSSSRLHAFNPNLKLSFSLILMDSSFIKPSRMLHKLPPTTRNTTTTRNSRTSLSFSGARRRPRHSINLPINPPTKPPTSLAALPIHHRSLTYRTPDPLSRLIRFRSTTTRGSINNKQYSEPHLRPGLNLQ